MELREFLKKCMIDFLLIQAGITLAIGIIGCTSSPEGQVNYYILFMPFLYAFFCLLPSFITYSSKELSIRQMIFRKVIQFLLIELIVLLISYLAEALVNTFLCITIMLTVVVIYSAVNLIDFYIEKTNSDSMTRKIQQLKESTQK